MLSRAAGKENRNAVVRQEELDTYIDELTLELNEAYTHIHALKEQNGRLLRTVADHVRNHIFRSRD